MIGNHDHPVLEDERPPAAMVKSGLSSGLTDKDIFFAKERYKLHQSMPDEGVETDILKKYFFKKYGF